MLKHNQLFNTKIKSLPYHLDKLDTIARDRVICLELVYYSGLTVSDKCYILRQNYTEPDYIRKFIQFVIYFYYFDLVLVVFV